MHPTGHDHKLLSSPAMLLWFAIAIALIYVLGSIVIGDVWSRTLGLGLAASALAIPLGLIIRWAIRQGGRAGRWLTLACLVLSILPMVIHVSAWDAAIGKLGWLTTARGNVLTPLLSGWWAAVWTHGLIAAPQIGLLLNFCDKKQQRIYEEQALLDSSEWTTFFKISMWRMLPLLMVSVLWVIVTCSREITITDLYQVETFAEQIYLGYSLGTGNIAGVWSTTIDVEVNVGFWTTAIYVSLLAIAAVAMFIILTDVSQPNENDTSNSTQRVSRIASLVSGILLLMLVAVPAANVLVRASFYVDTANGQPIQKYSFEQVLRVLEKSCLDYHQEMVWSLIISLASATTAILCSVLLVRWTYGSATKRWIFAIVVAIGLALPGPVTGSVLASVFATPAWPWFVWLVNYTVFAPVVATTIFTGPLVALAVWFVLHQTPKNVTEAASLDGLSEGSSFLAGTFCRKFIFNYWLLAIGLRTMFW